MLVKAPELDPVIILSDVVTWLSLMVNLILVNVIFQVGVATKTPDKSGLSIPLSVDFHCFLPGVFS